MIHRINQNSFSQRSDCSSCTLTSNEACTANGCKETCGYQGGPCCSGNTCDSGLTCCSDNTCESSCGGGTCTQDSECNSGCCYYTVGGSKSCANIGDIYENWLCAG